MVATGRAGARRRKNIGSIGAAPSGSGDAAPIQAVGVQRPAVVAHRGGSAQCQPGCSAPSGSEEQRGRKRGASGKSGSSKAAYCPNCPFGSWFFLDSGHACCVMCRARASDGIQPGCSAPSGSEEQRSRKRSASGEPGVPPWMDCQNCPFGSWLFLEAGHTRCVMCRARGIDGIDGKSDAAEEDKGERDRSGGYYKDWVEC